jgi:hypothetical protein
MLGVRVPDRYFAEEVLVADDTEDLLVDMLVDKF